MDRDKVDHMADLDLVGLVIGDDDYDTSGRTDKPSPAEGMEEVTVDDIVR